MRAVGGLLALGAVLLLAGGAQARTTGFSPYAGGFTAPVFVTSAPGDPSTLYVVEQGGTIRIVQSGSITGTFLDISSLVHCCGERGLLSMAFSPGYATNHLFYVSYDDLNGNSHVAQYRSQNGVGVRGSAKILLSLKQPYTNHKGGQLQFDTRGYLYIGFGDGGGSGDPNQTAQNTGTRLGKLLRSTTTTPDGSWTMVGLGLRNPWRFSFDADDNLWLADVGQVRWEEVDFRPAAKLDTVANYGWSRYEGNVIYDSSHRYSSAGEKVSPVWVYGHSAGCAIQGGYVHGGRYYYGDHCSGTVWSFPVGPTGRTGPPRVDGNVPSLSSFGVDGNGNLYGVSLDGEIYLLG